MIRIDSLCKSFGSLEVLKNVSVEIREGSVTSLIGPSGSGKSTLLRSVNLLEIPDSGTLTVGSETLSFAPGKNIDRTKLLSLRRKTGMVFQNFQLFPHRNVVENVMEGLIVVQKWPKPRARERAMELLEKVGLPHKAESWPATLSGGQQQRVAIARALAAKPEVLLCDEPTSALDPELAAEVVDVLKKLAAEGTTMIVATHDLRLAAGIANQAVFLDGGQIVEAGSPKDLFAAPRHERTRAFVSAVSGFDADWHI